MNGKIGGKCACCGKEPHGKKMPDGSISNTATERKEKCPAKDKNCDKCGKQGHLKHMCQANPEKKEKAKRQAGGSSTKSQSNEWTEDVDWYETVREDQDKQDQTK